MSKVKSREEQRLEGYRQFIKDKEIAEKLEKVFDKDMGAFIKKAIKKIIPEFDNEDVDFLLSDLKGEYASLISKELTKGVKQYNNAFSKNLAIFLKQYDNSLSEGKLKKLINEIEDKFETYYKIIHRHLLEMAQLQYQLGQERSLFSICLENFKGFSDKNDEKDNTIAIKPITLIYGPNSYGKSSIIQSLLLLYQTVTEEFDFKSVTLKLNGNFVNLGSFEDFVNKNSKEKEFKIELSLPYKVCNPDDTTLTKIIIGYNFAIEKSLSTEHEQIVLKKIEVSKKEKDINYSTKSNPWKIPVYEFIQREDNVNEYDIYRYGENTRESVDKKSFFTLCEFPNNDFYDNIFEFIEDAIKNIFYISSFRNPPERYYIPEYSIRKYVGKNGENTREILGSDSDVREKVSSWLKKITGYTLSEGNDKDRKISSINLNDATTEIKNINLVDLGSGVAQVLPIITQSFITPERKSEYQYFTIGNHSFYHSVERQDGNMVLIEEPEIHLHPRAQAELGSMFADAIKETNNTFIIETHSENLLLRLEKLIRKGELSKDDVSIIYVHKDKLGSHCIPLKLDNEGDIVNIKEIPGGFFEEGYNELFEND